MKRTDRQVRGMSIRVKFTLLTIGILALTIFSVYLLVSTRLEPYSISRKQLQFREEIAMIQEAAEENFSEDSIVALEKKIRGTNVETVIVANWTGTPYLVFATSYNLSERLSYLESILNGTKEDPELNIMEQTEDYLMCRGFNRKMGYDQLDCIGYADENILYYMMMPLESIHSSVVLFSRFLLMAGVGAIIAGGILIYLVTSTMTKPILKLAELSGEMADLRFDVRYEGNSRDEIGELGENFNHMSDSLNRAITDLRNANRQLEADLREKEEIDERRRLFLSNVSHELKTPIALIQGYAEGLQEGITEDPESTAFYCDVIVDEAQKMNQIVRRLLNLDEIESGQMEVHPEVFDLAELIRGIAGSTKMLAGDKAAELRIDLPHSIPVDADQFMVETILQNYLSNAWHYVSDPGTVTISSVDGKPGCVILSVHNTGDPIPEEDIEHIWDKFYKVDKARTRSYGGSGIGLSIVKAIINAHHTRCGVINRDGGVDFWFELRKGSPEENEYGVME